MTQPPLETKKCSSCPPDKAEKLLTEFSLRTSPIHGTVRRGQCKECISISAKTRYEENREERCAKGRASHHANKEENNRKSREAHHKNREERLAKKRAYHHAHKEERNRKGRENHHKNKEERNQKSRENYAKNKEDRLQYRRDYVENHKDEVRQSKNDYEKRKNKSDPAFRLRRYVSRAINITLKANGSSKDGFSVLKFLPYSPEELRQHIEKQFEPWMNWDNQGYYVPAEWDDNDPTTWMWQLDHIIPQSDLAYISMEDDNFKKCWALTNLRPLSAKQNLLDGTTRVRHKSKPTHKTKEENERKTIMSNNKKTISRSSKTGKFVTKKFADKHPATTETEKVKTGTKKKKA